MNYKIGFRIKKMNNAKLKIFKANFYKVLSYFSLIIIAFNLIFARSFVGITLFGFRIGELEIAAGLFISLMFVGSFRKFPFSFSKDFDNIFRLIIISFIIVVVLTGSSILNTFAFKSSSYIWSVSFIFVGVLIHKFIGENINKLSPLFFTTPFIVYIMSSGNYPNFVMQFFIDYSDKFQFLKASDILIAFLASYFLLKSSKVNRDFIVICFFIYGSLFLPVLMKLSRGSFLGLILFLLIEGFYLKEYFKNEKIKTSILACISILLFSLSTFRITDAEITNESITPQTIVNNVEEITKDKNTSKAFLSFYINEYGYLDSWDATTSWRLDIWQDVITDMYKEDILLTGYGYKSILPQMLDPTAPGRLGRDGLNEHVHNYLVSIISRGGFLQFILFTLLHLCIVRIWRRSSGNFNILAFVIPLMFVSLFDISMDGVQFPLIYYSTLGYQISKVNN